MALQRKHVQQAFSVLRKNGFLPNGPSKKWDVIDPATKERFPPKAVLRLAKELAKDTSFTGGGGWPTNDPLQALGFDVVLKEGRESTDTSSDLAAVIASSVDATTKERLVNARLGQGGYRESLLDMWGGRCALTGCDIVQVLRASHIKPWRDSTNEERLDPFNGVLLAASIDALFDRNLITVGADDSILVSCSISCDALIRLGLTRGRRLSLSDRRDNYIVSHRTNFEEACDGDFYVF